MKHKFKALTFIEITLVIGIFALVSVIVVPITVSELSRDRLKDQVVTIVSQIELVQQKGVTGQDGSSYGLAIGTDGYTLYEGDNLAGAVQSETVNYPDSIQVSNISTGDGTGEIRFDKGEVRPSTTLSMNISGSGGETYQLTINNEGLIDFVKI